MPNPVPAEYLSEEFQYDYFDHPEYTSDITTHAHNGWEFLFIKSGELSYSVDGNIFDIAPNSLIIARPGAVHSLHPVGVIRYERHDLIVSEHLLRKTIMELLPQTLHVIDVSKESFIPSLFEKFGFYLAHLQGEELDILLRGLINEIWVNIYLNTRLSSSALGSHSNAVITKAIRYIKEHIQEPLTVPKICDALFISPSYLYHSFAKHMNVSPKQYIMLQKLQMVQLALADGSNPTEICQEFGFRNYSTFYRNYQKFYGYRPSDNPKQSLLKIEL